ncbi:MAG TPA: hypothetical protein VIK61_10590 [Acidimicrobiia bacterium]
MTTLVEREAHLRDFLDAVSCSVFTVASLVAFTSFRANSFDVPTSCSVILNAESMIFRRGASSPMSGKMSLTVDEPPCGFEHGLLGVAHRIEYPVGVFEPVGFLCAGHGITPPLQVAPTAEMPAATFTLTPPGRSQQRLSAGP